MRRLFLRALHLWFRLTRPMTLGVRAAVLDGYDRVFLVRHTYIPGWHLPGGGVEPGETAEDALARELREEAGLEPTGTPELFAVYHNARMSRRDYVLLYVVRSFRSVSDRVPDREIAERGFFPMAALPDGTNAATRSRLAEIRGAEPPPALW